MCIDSLKGITLNKTSTSPERLKGLHFQFVVCENYEFCEDIEVIKKSFKSFYVSVYLIQRQIDMSKYG